MDKKKDILFIFEQGKKVKHKKIGLMPSFEIIKSANRVCLIMNNKKKHLDIYFF